MFKLMFILFGAGVLCFHVASGMEGTALFGGLGKLLGHAGSAFLLAAVATPVVAFWRTITTPPPAISLDGD